MDEMYRCSNKFNLIFFFYFRGEQGCVVYSTKPKILVCDLTLFEDQKKDC